MLTALRLAVRQLLKTPGFTATALATLAICIGANLTIFAVVDAILVRSLPFPAADRLLTVFNGYPGAGIDHAGASIPNYFDWRRDIKAFSSVSLYHESSVIIGGEGSPNRVLAMRITPEFFSTLGVPLAMGKAFTDAQLAYGADEVAILTDAFWRGHFNADPGVIGRTFVNDGITITVVGVLPRDFRFLSSQAQLYRPASHDPEDRLPIRRHSEGWEMVARLAPGATLAGAQAQIDAYNARQAADDPIAQVVKSVGYHTTVAGLRDDYVHKVRPVLVLLQCGVVLLLLIGGVNLANLFLIRASGRTKELAVRQALGAGRLHLALDALAETTLLALAGGLCGLLVGAWGIDILPALGTDKLPLGGSIAFDGRVAAVALAASIAVGWLLASPAIWFNLHLKLATGLQAESRGGTAGRAAQKLRHGFIVAQVALAFVLLSGAGLLGASLKHALDAPAGFNPTNILAGNVSLPWKSYKDNGSRLAFVERLLAAIHGLPGVTQAAINSDLPFSGSDSASSAAVEGITGKPGEIIHTNYYSAATSEYWPMMGIRLLRGRLLEDADNHRKPDVCVVDQAFAERYWPGADPVGHRLTAFEVAFDKDKAVTIVGVVANVRQKDLSEASGYGNVYLAYSVVYASDFALVVRTTLPPEAMAPMVRKAILQLDPGLPIDDLRPMQSRIDDSLVGRRSPAILAGIFAAVALLLAAIGTYGVLSYAVSRRQREIGVRMALGAQPGQILKQFLAIGLRLLAAGAVLGLAGAWCAGRAMQTILFGVPALPAGIFAGTLAVMVTAALAACVLPIRRATRIDPATVLRAD